MTIEYSVVVPIKNEEDNIEALVFEIEKTMQTLKKPWELLYVDDGSTDKSLEILLKLKKTHPFLKIIVFEKNKGQSSAFDAGFKMAQGRWIITLDGDGQNDPADIPLLLQHADQHELVCGLRTKRQDSLTKKITSRLANKVRSYLLEDHITDTGCSLKIFQKSALSSLKLYHGMHRFFPALFIIEGYRVKGVPVQHRPRTRGISKYHFFNRSIAPLYDLLSVYWMKKRKLAYKIKEIH